MRAAWALALLALVLSGCRTATMATPNPSAPPPTNAPTADKPFRIVGYVMDWDTQVSAIQFDKLTHINYAFVTPKADGTFNTIQNPQALKEIVERAHAHGVKVLIAVGGWGWDEAFEALAANPKARAIFVMGLHQFATEYALDGIDMDWEYPDPGPSAQNYLALMRELHALLAPEGKLLTAAVIALGSTGGGVPAEVFELTDFINLMAYDGPGPHHSPFEYAEASLEYWHQRGLPPEKTVLGVPFYSRPGEFPYRVLVQANAEAAQANEIDHQGTKVYYNGLPGIEAKTTLALQRASGVMIWALAHDTTDSNSLLSAIYTTAYAPREP